MRSNWWASTLVANGIQLLSMAVFLALMAWRRLVRRWPSVVTAVGFELATNLALFGLLTWPGHYKQYFYLYWAGSAIQSLLRLWIIADIVRRFPGIRYLPRELYVFVAIAGASMAAASAAYTWDQADSFRNHVSNGALMLNGCVNSAWAAFAVAFLIAIKIQNLGWSVEGAKLATGVFLRVCSDNAVSALMREHSRRAGIAANLLDPICCIAVFILWIVYLAKYQPPSKATTLEDRPDINRHLAALREFCSSRER